MLDGIQRQLSITFGDYFEELQMHPWQIATAILDIIIVLFIIYLLIRFARKTKVWSLLKGITILIVVTLVSGWLKLRVLNFILSTIMTYGVIALLIIFQPELRRGLETIGSNTNGFTKLFGIDKSIKDKTKDDIYMSVIAVEELAKNKVGGLIVFEREVKIKDIIDTGIKMNCDVSPQVLVNIFVPNTPLHDGAVIISNNQIQAAACLLPLADDKDLARELGTRHRAAIGISKDSDAIAIVVSEETGKISIAKNGTLISNVSEDALKRILLKSLIYDRFGDENSKDFKDNFKNKITERKHIRKKKSDKILKTEETIKEEKKNEEKKSE